MHRSSSSPFDGYHSNDTKDASISSMRTSLTESLSQDSRYFPNPSEYLPPAASLEFDARKVSDSQNRIINIQTTIGYFTLL
jgi:hypothetical protein